MAVGSSSPTPGALPPEDANAGEALVQALRVLEILRRRWLVIVVTTVLCIAAAAIAIAVLPPQWRATATVVLHMNSPQVVDKIKGISEDADGRVLAYKEYYETQRQIMRSRAVCERALARLGLASDPVFLGIDRIASEPERLARQQQIDPVERLRAIVDVEEIQNSRVLAVSAEYPDPEVAAEIVNAVTDAYLEYVRSGRTKLGIEAKQNLGNERSKAQLVLRDSERALEEYKRSNDITSVSLEDRQNVITQNILTLSERSKRAEAERIALQSTYRQAKQLFDAGNLAAATLMPEQERTILEGLRKEQIEAQREFERANVVFGPKAPEFKKAEARLTLVDDRVEKESAALLASLEARMQAAADTERGLTAALQKEHERAMALSMLERDYRELERESKTAAGAYELLSMRDAEIGITNRIEGEGIEILDRATVPHEAVFPPKVVLLVLALVGGSSLGALLALGIDVRDQRIRSLFDLERAMAGLGLPVLGQLPLLSTDTRLGVGNIRAQRRQRDLYTHLFPQSLMAERCRGVRTAISFAQGTEPLRTIMITSPNSAEGKSSTAINLALSFCQANKRVILIDADMRRPRLHQVFASPEREDVGLAQILLEQSSLDEARIAAGPESPSGLDVLACGAVPSNPAELLDTPGSRRLLAELRERYDVVIIDSPPVLPVTDPLLLARQVDGVVVVARCEGTTRGELQRALTQLRQGDTNILGVVLNEVDARQERYDYGYGYYTAGNRAAEVEPS